MSTNPGKDGGLGTLATIGIVALPVLCCALPVLIAAGALGAVGSVLGNPWVIGTGLAIALAVVAIPLRRRADRAAGAADNACCPPEPPAHAEQSDHNRRPQAP